MRQLVNNYQINSHDRIPVEVYLQFISEIKQIDSEKEVELIKSIGESDNDALRELVKTNLWLVVSISKQYQNMGLSLHDLILEGNLGLVSAAKRLGNCKEFNFKSYATGWVRQSILQAITENFLISKLSLNNNGYKNKINEVLHQINRNFLSEPIIDKMSEFMEMQSK